MDSNLPFASGSVNSLSLRPSLIAAMGVTVTASLMERRAALKQFARLPSWSMIRMLSCGSASIMNSVAMDSSSVWRTVFLDRNVAAILACRPDSAASQQQKRALAAMIHLCGAASAKAFAQRGFHLIAGERCGDHDVAPYLAPVSAMTQEFLRLAAET